jgi:hypothetical protein
VAWKFPLALAVRVLVLPDLINVKTLRGRRLSRRADQSV